MRKSTTPGNAKESLTSKKPYRTPQLTVHGDFRKLTADKGGTKGDSSGKPSTRNTGGPA